MAVGALFGGAVAWEQRRPLVLRVLTAAAWATWFPGMWLPLVELVPFEALHTEEDLPLSTVATLRFLRASECYVVLCVLFLFSAVLPLLRLVTATIAQLGPIGLEELLRRLAVLGSYQLLDALLAVVAVAFCNSECYQAELRVGFGFSVANCLLSQLVILMLLGPTPAHGAEAAAQGLFLEVDEAQGDEASEAEDEEKSALLGGGRRMMDGPPAAEAAPGPAGSPRGAPGPLRSNRRTALANGTIVFALVLFGSSAPLLDSAVTLDGVAFCRHQLGIWQVLERVGAHAGGFVAVVLALVVVVLPLAVAALGYLGTLRAGDDWLLRLGAALAPCICTDVHAVALVVFLFTAQGDHLRTEIPAGSFAGVTSNWFSGVYVGLGMGVAGFSLKWKVLTEDSLGAPTRPGMIRPAGDADYRLVAQQDAPEEEFGTAGDPSHAAEDACDDDDEPDESEPLIPRAPGRPVRAASSTSREPLAAASLSQPLQGREDDDGPVWEDWECPDKPSCTLADDWAQAEGPRDVCSPPRPPVPVAPSTPPKGGSADARERRGRGGRDPEHGEPFEDPLDSAGDEGAPGLAGEQAELDLPGALHHISAASRGVEERRGHPRGRERSVLRTELERLACSADDNVQRVNACGWWTLWVVVCLFARSPVTRPISDEGVNAALGRALPTLNGLLRVSAPATVGDCFADDRPPSPCDDVGPLFDQAPRHSEGWTFTIRWLTGVNTVWIEEMSVAFIPESLRPVQVQVRGFLERLNVSLAMEKCEDSPRLSCQSLWDSAEECCERHRAFHLVLGAVCYEGTARGQPGPAQLGALEAAWSTLDDLGARFPSAQGDSLLSEVNSKVREVVQRTVNGLFVRERVFFNLTLSELITRLWQYNSGGVADRHCSDFRYDQ